MICEKSQCVRDFQVLWDIERKLHARTHSGYEVFILLFGGTGAQKRWEPLP